MKAPTEDMVRSLGATIRSEPFLESGRTDAKWFFPNRVLAFSFCVCMILMRMVTSLRSEPDAFFENKLEIDRSVTPQAFSKARRHIRAEAFASLFEGTRKMIVRANAIRRYHGYRLYRRIQHSIALE